MRGQNEGTDKNEEKFVFRISTFHRGDVINGFYSVPRPRLIKSNTTTSHRQILFKPLVYTKNLFLEASSKLPTERRIGMAAEISGTGSWCLVFMYAVSDFPTESLIGTCETGRITLILSMQLADSGKMEELWHTVGMQPCRHLATEGQMGTDFWGEANCCERYGNSK